MAGSVIGAVGSILGGNAAASGANAAANASRAASDRATDLQKEMFYKNVEMQEPWRAAGTDAVNVLRSALLTGGLNSPLLKPYQEQQFNYTADPGYAFRLAQGQQAMDRSAAAAGGLQSGAALKAAARYGQDMGSQEYGNAWNRFQADQTNKYNRHNTSQDNIFNRLSGLAGTGQKTANALGNAGANMASNVGNIGMSNAANQGNAAIARGNANASMYGGVGNALAYGLGSSGGGGNILTSLYGGLGGMGSGIGAGVASMFSPWSSFDYGGYNAVADLIDPF